MSISYNSNVLLCVHGRAGIPGRACGDGHKGGERELRYMLMVYTDELLRSQNSREEMRELIAGHAAVKREAKEKGALHMGAPLKPVSTATTIRINNGEISIVDGPFADTKEQLAGFYVLECENLDEAMEWAKKFATVCGHRGDACFEIRPFEDYSYWDRDCGDEGS